MPLPARGRTRRRAAGSTRPFSPSASSSPTSHELRTPLARLKTLAQLTLADPNASVDSLRAAHERVLASEQQLEDLIEALLNLATGERGLDRREPVELGALTGDVLARRRAEIERRGLRLHATFDPPQLRAARRCSSAWPRTSSTTRSATTPPAGAST